jgi:phosphoribosylformylglycinamidine cyclo-ligase
MGLTYKDSGVNIESGNNFVKRISPFVKSTFSERVLTDIGGFGALYSGAFPEMTNPVLVSGTDGVGTKLQIAKMMNKHDTIGIDAVAMCVNDIAVSGANPLFFLDYISCGKINEDVLTDVIKGVADGCNQAGCSLIGGETAEHPGVMESDDYDIAGFAVGVVDKDKIINGYSIQAGDSIIGLASSGIHSNGFSMVRKVFFGLKNYTLNHKFNDLELSLGETLLVPTRIYVKSVLSALKNKIDIKGLVHITGGGFYENIPRILPENVSAQVDINSYTVPQIFKIMQSEGDISDIEMYTTFNMGIGMMVFVPAEQTDTTIDFFNSCGEKAYLIGHTVKNEGVRVVI